MKDDLTKMVQEEIAENSENKVPEKNAEKIEKKSVEKTEKIEENAQESVKNAENNDLEEAEKITDQAPEPTAEENTEQEEANEPVIEPVNTDEIEPEINEGGGEENEDEAEGEQVHDDTEFIDAEPLAESETDPLLDQIENAKKKKESEPKKTTGEELGKKTTGSSKNRENLEKIGLLVLTRADIAKAKMCSKISGQHTVEYLADDEIKEALIAAIREYLASQEFKEPSPFATLMLALSAWVLPSLGVALFDKYMLPKKEKETSTTSTVEEEKESTQKTDYSHLKEYQDNRKIFSTNADGFYDRSPKGTFIKKAIADEKPSPVVQQWIEEGLSNKEIRKQLNHGK